MVGKRWTKEKAQDDFLEGFLPEYLSLVPTKEYGDFWGRVREAWEKSFPEINYVWPDSGKTEALLSSADREVLKVAKKARGKVSLFCFYKKASLSMVPSKFKTGIVGVQKIPRAPQGSRTRSTRNFLSHVNAPQRTGSCSGKYMEITRASAKNTRELARQTV